MYRPGQFDGIGEDLPRLVHPWVDLEGVDKGTYRSHAHYFMRTELDENHFYAEVKMENDSLEVRIPEHPWVYKQVVWMIIDHYIN